LSLAKNLTHLVDMTIDFPPMLAGLEYDLTESCSAQLWPK